MGRAAVHQWAQRNEAICRQKNAGPFPRKTFFAEQGRPVTCKRCIAVRAVYVKAYGPKEVHNEHE